MPNKNLKFSILIHYSEIGLKKNNRSYFERLFIKNISNHIFGLDHKKIRLLSARVFIENKHNYISIAKQYDIIWSKN